MITGAKFILSFLCLLSCAGLTLADDGQDPKALVGTWNGVEMPNDSEVAVTLAVLQVVADAPSGSLHFGGPRYCKLDLVFVRPVTGGFSFHLSHSNGGYCNRLEGGTAALSVVDGNVSLTTVLENGTTEESTTLYKAE